MKCDKKSMLLYAVTGQGGKLPLCRQVEAALKGGATCVQLREKNADEKKFLEDALEISALCKRFGVLFIVNDNVEAALRCNADGVHVGRHDMAPDEVRKAVGNDMVIGVSVHSAAEAVRAVEAGADYLGAGAVFPTKTKADAAPLSKETLREICAAADVPVVAIGGINKHNILELSGTGVDGAALVSAIFSADDIESECRLLRRLSEKMVSETLIPGRGEFL